MLIDEDVNVVGYRLREIIWTSESRSIDTRCLTDAKSTLFLYLIHRWNPRWFSHRWLWATDQPWCQYRTNVSSRVEEHFSIADHHHHHHLQSWPLPSEKGKKRNFLSFGQWPRCTNRKDSFYYARSALYWSYSAKDSILPCIDHRKIKLRCMTLTVVDDMFAEMVLFSLSHFNTLFFLFPSSRWEEKNVQDWM